MGETLTDNASPESNETALAFSVVFYSGFDYDRIENIFYEFNNDKCFNLFNFVPFVFELRNKKKSYISMVFKQI